MLSATPHGECTSGDQSGHADRHSVPSGPALRWLACPLCHSSDQEKTKPPETTLVSHASHDSWHVTCLWFGFGFGFGFGSGLGF